MKFLVFIVVKLNLFMSEVLDALESEEVRLKKELNLLLYPMEKLARSEPCSLNIYFVMIVQLSCKDFSAPHFYNKLSSCRIVVNLVIKSM